MPNGINSRGMLSVVRIDIGSCLDEFAFAFSFLFGLILGGLAASRYQQLVKLMGSGCGVGPTFLHPMAVDFVREDGEVAGSGGGERNLRGGREVGNAREVDGDSEEHSGAVPENKI
ncbi:hypothetical protein C8F01DRAFT_1093746 [Mycena amicta]|nr:hypothetical protein C8F01DRAFT_1093746 [Mycena amicta]